MHITPSIKKTELVSRIIPTGIEVASRCSKSKEKFYFSEGKIDLFGSQVLEYVYFRFIFVSLLKCENYALLVFNLQGTNVHRSEFSVRHHTDIDNNVII